ncbi:uncharacterized protein LAESUDRAFT_66371 [Laetiporus sulphureus 93-53]|uniref:BTB domain-containing protein n=1 Tax=Laetiporus sulphureus 93-53 TaxID=1314785 RepID=A0A165F584_9APHY|nr:uncharacterized protein LAESUDRAFT_66371 [Laetiporus sulphureus 93-53]KZT08415.1 hypothetical protein LAESUDRAFT_66371 [Laetiporus sulphureus 93-53]
MVFKTVTGKKTVRSQDDGTPPPGAIEPIVPRGASVDEILFAVLNFGISNGMLFDAELHAYSNRTASGTVDGLLPVYANSVALKNASEYFARLLSADWADRASVDGEEYDYASDSDLEDVDESEGDMDGVSSKPFQRLATHSSASVQERKPLKDNHDNGVASLEAAQSSSSLSAQESPMDAKTSGSADHGRIRRILPAVAYKTLKAFAFYTLTKKVDFAPLRSQPTSIRREKASTHRMAYDSPQCSPKSMYRFAHMCEIKELKELALEDIKSKLSPDNILEELFSTLTSRYPEVQKAEVAYLLDNGLTPDVIAAMPDWIAKVAAGELGPLSGDVLAILFEKLAATRVPFVCRHCSGTSFKKECSDCGRWN